MNGYNTNKKDENNDMYYEIEYDSCPMPGVGKFVLKQQKIEEPVKDEVKDEIRELFLQMRTLAKGHRLSVNYAQLFRRNIQEENALIFYKQGMFMKDFTDYYSDSNPFSQYYPHYQMLGYSQLRTYFTWRTKVREGTVVDTALSYAFLYIYELLSNIGVDNPKDGLDKLLFFWQSFRIYNKVIDKYVVRWLKDYHIYYELPQSFKEFIDAHQLMEYYPQILDTDNEFDTFCTISKYDIRKSNFYSENEKLVIDCFHFVMDQLKEIIKNKGIQFNENIFQTTQKMTEWRPFQNALFYPWIKQRDRQVVITKNEVYLCNDNQWFTSTTLISESNRRLKGYILKQMEVTLRKIVNYKYKLSANIDTVGTEMQNQLHVAGLDLEGAITSLVTEFYKEETRTIVTVDMKNLSRIRQEAFVTQEKLMVPDEEKIHIFPTVQAETATPKLKPTLPAETATPKPTLLAQEATSMTTLPTKAQIEQDDISDPWQLLKDAFTDIEKKALSILLYDETNIKQFADEYGIMLEVLIDQINEKAMDFMGDNLMDEEFVLYDEYKEQVKEWIE